MILFTFQREKFGIRDQNGGKQGTVLERGQLKSLGTNHPETSLHVLFSLDEEIL